MTVVARALELDYDAYAKTDLSKFADEKNISSWALPYVRAMVGADYIHGRTKGLEPLEPEPVPIFIGTDATEVSHSVPLITISAATMCRGTSLHHWAAAKQAGMSIGHKGMLYAARCMAEGTKLLLDNPGKLTAAWEEFKNTDA